MTYILAVIGGIAPGRLMHPARLPPLRCAMRNPIQRAMPGFFPSSSNQQKQGVSAGAGASAFRAQRADGAGKIHYFVTISGLR
ncbi:MAG: hypothetical protein GY862_33790, partial [Gammaproteobacteria bacterium]|nr:hypothetical protein [Gammaproteobacteria bacterium]